MLIDTVEELMRALGGNKQLAVLTGVGMPAVSNWKKAGWVPSRHYFVVRQALPNHELAEKLFRIRPLQSAAE